MTKKLSKNLLFIGLIFAVGASFGADDGRLVTLYSQKPDSAKREFEYTFDLDRLGSKMLAGMLEGADESELAQGLNLAKFKNSTLDTQTMGALHVIHNAIDLNKPEKPVGELLTSGNGHSLAVKFKLLSAFDFLQIGAEIDAPLLSQVLKNLSSNTEVLSVINAGAFDGGLYGKDISAVAGESNELNSRLRTAVLSLSLGTDTSDISTELSYEVVSYEDDSVSLLDLAGNKIANLGADIRDISTEPSYVAVRRGPLFGSVGDRWSPFPSGRWSLLDLAGNKIVDFDTNIHSIRTGPSYVVAFSVDCSVSLLDLAGNKIADLGADIRDISTEPSYVAVSYRGGKCELFYLNTLRAIGNEIDTLSLRDLLLIRALTPATGTVALNKNSRAFDLFKKLPYGIPRKIRDLKTVKIT